MLKYSMYDSNYLYFATFLVREHSIFATIEDALMQELS